MNTPTFFKQLVAHLNRQGVPPKGQAVVQLGNNWVPVVYDLAQPSVVFWRIYDSEGCYNEPTEWAVVENEEADPLELGWLLGTRWLALPPL